METNDASILFGKHTIGNPPFSLNTVYPFCLISRSGGIKFYCEGNFAFLFDDGVNEKKDVQLPEFCKINLKDEEVFNLYKKEQNISQDNLDMLKEKTGTEYSFEKVY